MAAVRDDDADGMPGPIDGFGAPLKRAISVVPLPADMGIEETRPATDVVAAVRVAVAVQAPDLAVRAPLGDVPAVGRAVDDVQHLLGVGRDAPGGRELVD